MSSGPGQETCHVKPDRNLLGGLNALPASQGAMYILVNRVIHYSDAVAIQQHCFPQGTCVSSRCQPILLLPCSSSIRFGSETPML